MKLAGCLLAVMLIAAGPATKPSAEQDLRRIVQSLRDRIAELNDENWKLKSDLEAERATTKKHSLVLRAFDLKEGMFPEQVNKIMGGEPNNGHAVYEQNAQTVSWTLGKDTTVSGSRIEVRFEAGKVESVRLRIGGLTTEEMK